LDSPIILETTLWGVIEMNNYPYHINPNTNRANKCYKPGDCRFNISQDEHYATATEALAARDEKTAAQQLHEASLQYYRAHDKHINELYSQVQEERVDFAETLQDLVTKAGIEVTNSMTPREVLKKIEASEKAEDLQDSINEARVTLRGINRESRLARKADSDYSGWARYFESEDGTIHSNRTHQSNTSNWRGDSDRTWLVDLSGKTIEEVIEKAGPNLCSECFTNADDSAKKTSKNRRRSKIHCKGSNTEHFDRETADLGNAGGNTAICNDCGQKITVNLTGKLRLHRKENVRTGTSAKAQERTLQDA